jgi:putative membrane protein
MPYQEFVKPLASSKTLGYVALLALLMGVYGCAPLWVARSSGTDLLAIPSGFSAAMSLVLGCLLVFRTNTAYQRWWEARTLWGQLVNASRNLAIKLCSLGSLTAGDLSRAQQLIVAFPHALRCHLRSEPDSGLTDSSCTILARFEHVPQGIANELYRELGAWKSAHRLDGDELRVIDGELRRLLDICGGCERILRTPIVKSYRFFARQCVLLFLASLPWGIANEFGLWTVPLTIIISYFMLGLEIVAEHVEEPFGYDEDDLDLDGLCLTIQTSVNEVFRDRQASDVDI